MEISRQIQGLSRELGEEMGALRDATETMMGSEYSLKEIKVLLITSLARE
jgi:hypothetical protein